MLRQLPLAIQRNLHSRLLKNNIFLMEPAGFALNMPFDLTQTMGDSKMCQTHPFFPHYRSFPFYSPPFISLFLRKKKKKVSWKMYFLDRHSLVVLNVTLSERVWERRPWMMLNVSWLFAFVSVLPGAVLRLIYGWRIRPQRSNAEPLLTFKRLCFKMPRICPRQMLLPKVDLKRKKKKHSWEQWLSCIWFASCVHYIVWSHYIALPFKFCWFAGMKLATVYGYCSSPSLFLLYLSITSFVAKLYPFVHFQK